MFLIQHSNTTVFFTFIVRAVSPCGHGPERQSLKLSVKIIVTSSQVTFIYIALLTIQIVSKQLHNIKIGNFLSYRHFIIEFSDAIVQAQFSLNSICAIKLVILLEMKCPQLSKPEATNGKEPKLHR